MVVSNRHLELRHKLEARLGLFPIEGLFPLSPPVTLNYLDQDKPSDTAMELCAALIPPGSHKIITNVLTEELEGVNRGR